MAIPSVLRRARGREIRSGHHLPEGLPITEPDSIVLSISAAAEEDQGHGPEPEQQHHDPSERSQRVVATELLDVEAEQDRQVAEARSFSAAFAPEVGEKR